VITGGRALVQVISSPFGVEASCMGGARTVIGAMMEDSTMDMVGGTRDMTIGWHREETAGTSSRIWEFKILAMSTLYVVQDGRDSYSGQLAQVSHGGYHA